MLAALLPTLLLPVKILGVDSGGCKACAGVQASAGDGKLAAAAAAQALEPPSCSAKSATRNRMDSDIASREGSTAGGMAALAKAAAEAVGSTGAAGFSKPGQLARVWSIPSARDVTTELSLGATPPLPLPTIALIADTRMVSIHGRRSSATMEPLSVSKVSFGNDGPSSGGDGSLAAEGGGGSMWLGVCTMLSDVDVAVFFALAFLMGLGNGVIG